MQTILVISIIHISFHSSYNGHIFAVASVTRVLHSLRHSYATACSVQRHPATGLRLHPPHTLQIRVLR